MKYLEPLMQIGFIVILFGISIVISLVHTLATLNTSNAVLGTTLGDKVFSYVKKSKCENFYKDSGELSYLYCDLSFAEIATEDIEDLEATQNYKKVPCEEIIKTHTYESTADQIQAFTSMQNCWDKTTTDFTYLLGVTEIESPESGLLLRFSN